MKNSDLTQGNIRRQMVRLAAPLVAGDILQQLYNTMDAVIIGNFAGNEEFAAVGVAGTVMNLFLFIIVGACSGISVIFAQLYGQGNKKRFREEHFHALVMGIAAAVLLSGLGFLLLGWILTLIRTPGEIRQFTRMYLKVILIGLPLAYLYNLYSCMLRAVGHTRSALMILAVSTICNICLDLLFVAGFHGGIAGAAIATVLAEALSAVSAILLLRHTLPELFFTREDCVFRKECAIRQMRYSLATALHQSGLYIGKMFVQGAVNTGGTGFISAYTATSRIEGFANSFGTSGATATSILVAQNFGAGKKDRVRKTYRTSLLILLIMGAVCSVIMYFSAGTASFFMLGKSSGEAYEQAVSYLQIISYFYVFCFSGNTFAGYFDGIGKVMIPMAGAITHITLRVILSWLWIRSRGLSAVAWATGIGWILANTFWSIMKKTTEKALN